MKPVEDLMHEHEAITVMLSIMNKISENIRKQSNPDPEELNKVVDFLKTFADKCHHGKEETALFPALIEGGMSNQTGPVAVMLHEHELGRGFIKELALAAGSIPSTDKSAEILAAEAIENYVSLMQNHIRKENNVLFPMVDMLLSSGKQQNIYHAFESIEDEVVGHGVHEHFHDLLLQLRAKYNI